jgi:hypothetical protein
MWDALDPVKLYWTSIRSHEDITAIPTRIYNFGVALLELGVAIACLVERLLDTMRINSWRSLRL